MLKEVIVGSLIIGACVALGTIVGETAAAVAQSTNAKKQASTPSPAPVETKVNEVKVVEAKTTQAPKKVGRPNKKVTAQAA